jgi:predicted DNA-binding ribbon-helix-helix protein
MKSLILPVNALSPLWVPVTDRERPGGETTQSKGRSPDWVKVQNPHRTCCNEVDRGMKFDRRCELPIKSLVVKQSVIVNGRDSSVSLEGAFWKALKNIAVGQNISVPALVSKIDNEREAANLSSAIRVYVVEHYRLAANASADKPSNT